MAEGGRSRLVSWLLAAGISVMLVGVLVGLFLLNNRPPHIVVPTPKVPRDNGWDYFVRAGEMTKKINHPGPYSLARPVGSWTVPEYQAFVVANAPAMAVLRQGLGKAYLWPPVRSQADDARMFELLGGFREMARTLQGEAGYYAVVGQPAKAADSLMDCIEFGTTVPHGGGWMQGLVGVAIEAIGSVNFESLLPGLSSDELARVAWRLERIQSKRVSYGDIVEEEARMSTARTVDMFSSPEYLRSVANPGAWLNPGAVSGGVGGVGGVFSGVSFAFSNKTRMVRENMDYFQAVAAEQRLPYTGKSKVRVPGNPLAQVSLDRRVVLGCRESMTRSEANLALLRTEVALLRYKAAEKRWPARLSALVPRYLKPVPVDPFGVGKPLRYRLRSGGLGYRLYSVGPNMRDDSGVAGNRDDGYRQGDMVAGRL